MKKRGAFLSLIMIFTLIAFTVPAFTSDGSGGSPGIVDTTASAVFNTPLISGFVFDSSGPLIAGVSTIEYRLSEKALTTAAFETAPYVVAKTHTIDIGEASPSDRGIGLPYYLTHVNGTKTTNIFSSQSENLYKLYDEIATDMAPAVR